MIVPVGLMPPDRVAESVSLPPLPRATPALAAVTSFGPMEVMVTGSAVAPLVTAALLLSPL